MNGDGVPDLLVYHYEPPYSVQTFISSGKSGYSAGAVQTFNFPVNAKYPNVTNVPQLIDVNGDGKLDLLCGLVTAYGNGDGTFAAAVPVPFLSSGFVTSYADDLNGDGKTDILAVDAFPNFPLNPGPLQFAVTVFLIKVQDLSFLPVHFRLPPSCRKTPTLQASISLLQLLWT